jgi:hypothetical protein
MQQRLPSRTPRLHLQLTGPLPLAGLRPSSVTRTAARTPGNGGGGIQGPRSSTGKRRDERRLEGCSRRRKDPGWRGTPADSLEALDSEFVSLSIPKKAVTGDLGRTICTKSGAPCPPLPSGLRFRGVRGRPARTFLSGFHSRGAPRSGPCGWRGRPEQMSHFSPPRRWPLAPAPTNGHLFGVPFRGRARRCAPRTRR